MNDKKTKAMVFSKSKWSPENFTYDGKTIECVKDFQYLGFNISYDMKMKLTLIDRRDKAMKMANMLLQALKTSTNVSTKLSMSLFDKYVSPVFAYGSAVWGLPNKYNLLYLEYLPEGEGTRTTVTRVLRDCCGYNVPFTSARRVGKKVPNSARHILINLSSVYNKETIIQSAGTHKFTTYCDEPEADIEKIQRYFCKRSLNVNKHASNSAVMGELRRYPLTYNIWITVIKYWVRLSNGTENSLLNAAYKKAISGHHWWVQAVFNMMSVNGLKDNWFNPPNPTGGFHNVVKQRLRDQFLQNWRAQIRSSARFTLLNDLKSTFERSPYIDLVKNPETRLIFTRLRIDMNVFSDYMRKKYIGTATCPLCNRGPDSFQHILLHCPYFKEKRDNLFQNIELQLPRWRYMDDDMKLNWIFDLKCPNVIGSCCSYVHYIYTLRERCVVNLWFCILKRVI